MDILNGGATEIEKETDRQTKRWGERERRRRRRWWGRVRYIRIPNTQRQVLSCLITSS